MVPRVTPFCDDGHRSSSVCPAQPRTCTACGTSACQTHNQNTKDEILCLLQLEAGSLQIATKFTQGPDSCRRTSQYRLRLAVLVSSLMRCLRSTAIYASAPHNHNPVILCGWREPSTAHEPQTLDPSSTYLALTCAPQLECS